MRIYLTAAVQDRDEYEIASVPYAGGFLSEVVAKDLYFFSPRSPKQLRCLGVADVHLDYTEYFQSSRWEIIDIFFGLGIINCFEYLNIGML